MALPFGRAVAAAGQQWGWAETTRATGAPADRESPMAMLKVIEVLAESDKSWEDAAANAVKTATRTVRNVRSINVENLQATVVDGKLTAYRINAKIAFTLD
jgi:flavin-binding protein dodecin